MGGPINAPAVLPSIRAPGTHCTTGCEGPTIGLLVVDEIEAGVQPLT